jgi:hypothetical protein
MSFSTKTINFPLPDSFQNSNSRELSSGIKIVKNPELLEADRLFSSKTLALHAGFVRDFQNLAKLD